MKLGVTVNTLIQFVTEGVFFPTDSFVTKRGFKYQCQYHIYLPWITNLGNKFIKPICTRPSRNFMAVRQLPLWCSVTEPAEKCSLRGKPVFHHPAWRTLSSLCPRPARSPSPSLSPHRGPLPAAATVEEGSRRIWSWPPSWARLCWRRMRSWRPLWSRARGRWRYRTEQALLKNSFTTRFVKACTG